MVYTVYINNCRDHYGNFLYDNRVIAICESEAEAEILMKKIYDNPYFSGSIRFVPYEVNFDYSGFGNYNKGENKLGDKGQ